jgi:hypothetical protein
LPLGNNASVKSKIHWMGAKLLGATLGWSGPYGFPNRLQVVPGIRIGSVTIYFRWKCNHPEPLWDLL